MLIGICGKTNTGKTTFFSAATLVDAEIADRPFATIDPNKGIGYVRTKCPCSELGVKCSPKNSKCVNGIRMIPINIIDIAGLVPGAHEGRGLGNKFLDDIRTADGTIQVIDVSGKTDQDGNPCENYDPANEIRFLEEEFTEWIVGIMKRNWGKIKGRDIDEVAKVLSGLKVPESVVREVAEEANLETERINWSDEKIRSFVLGIRKRFPIVIAANKIDLEGADENYRRLLREFPDKKIIPTYADGELALRRAAKNGIVRYEPGDEDFEILNANSEQEKALEKIRSVMKKYGGTGVQKAIDELVFGEMKMIVVYPVADETHFTDGSGNVLPDAILVPKGTTAIQLAELIHEEIAKNFITAIDARTKMKIGRDHILKNGDVIKIVSR